MKKSRLLWQSIVCIVALIAAGYSVKGSSQTALDVYRHVMHYVNMEISTSDMENALDRTFNFLKDTPSKVVSKVINIARESQYGAAIDEKSDNRYKTVHAIAGGKVLSSGKDKYIGLFVKVKHENAVSVYGNLCDINVVEDERLQRGEIIGTFDTRSDKEFYFQLDEDM